MGKRKSAQTDPSAAVVVYVLAAALILISATLACVFFAQAWWL